MKRITTIIAALAALVCVGSCSSILDSIANVPYFQVRNLYDGQEFRIIRTSACNYEWYGFDKDIVSLEIKGKETWMTVSLPLINNDRPIKTKISAKNPDNAQVEPQTVEFEVRPWKLSVLEAVGDSWREVTPVSLKVGKKYSVSMVCREYGKEEWTSVSAINYTTLENTSLEWTIGNETPLQDIERHETYVTFTVKEPFALMPIVGKLPKKNSEIVLTATK